MWERDGESYSELSVGVLRLRLDHQLSVKCFGYDLEIG
jgi:hypothetical protein